MAPGIGSFEASDQFDERGFEGRMKAAGDNLEHLGVRSEECRL
jgi:hypothetical protein